MDVHPNPFSKLSGWWAGLGISWSWQIQLYILPQCHLSRPTAEGLMVSPRQPKLLCARGTTVIRIGASSRSSLRLDLLLGFLQEFS